MIKIRELKGTENNCCIIAFKTLLSEIRYSGSIYDELVNKYSIREYAMLRNVSLVDYWTMYRDWISRLENKKYTVTTTTGEIIEISIKYVTDTNIVPYLVISELPERFKNQRFINQQIEILLVKEMLEDAKHVRELLTDVLAKSMSEE